MSDNKAPAYDTVTSGATQGSVKPESGYQTGSVNADGTTSTVTTSGSTVTSDDPSTKPNASLGEKLKGDVKGAISGSVGSMQAATGTMIGNKNMEQKGLDKMSEEDQRLGAKHGVMPVGSDLRNTEAKE